ncbi:hypothetical protein TNCV_706671 [Trichonephila clavipes]|nr:hypothetical protein TNCV_706671 [Trichonephila clavipes]
MSGQHNGVQALLKEKNKFANYGRCAAHSLNLVRAELVKVATEIVNFFWISATNMFSFLLRPIDKSTDKAAYGTEKFKRDTLIVALDNLILALNRRSQVYAEYSKKFKFLDLQDQIIAGQVSQSVRLIQRIIVVRSFAC